MNIKAVIFDIDGTITTRNSWNYLVEYLGGSVDEEQKNFSDWQKGLITDEQADKKILQFWRSGGRANKTEFIKAFKTIPLRPDAQELIDDLKAHGKQVCLITGSMDLYAEIIAKRLGIQHYYANAVLRWNFQGEIIDFIYAPNQGQKKLEQFRNFCQENGLEPEECVAVGDSSNDYELFRETKKGIAVRSEFEDKVLEATAWKVVNNLLEIKEIIK